MFAGISILIAEDEAILALDLACAIAHLDGKVVGPVATVADALSLLEKASIAAAVVDANLLDRDVTTLAIALL